MTRPGRSLAAFPEKHTAHLADSERTARFLHGIVVLDMASSGTIRTGLEGVPSKPPYLAYDASMDPTIS